MNTRLKASLIAASIAALPFGADAAGLGRLNVMSALGQPLRAEVELSASAQELQSLTAKVPSPEAFKQANVAYSPAVATLRLAVEQRGGRSVLKISSDKPVNAPFVDLLIELSWSGGQLQREYTFLLDPPEMAPARAAVETAEPVARPQAAATPSKASRPAGEESRAGSGGSGTYEVQRGDTLQRIAAETRPEGVSLDQMMVALFRSNRSAFDADNINRLKAGKILSVPDAAQAQAISAAEARKEIAAHSVDFEGYRRNLAAAVASAPASAAPPAGQESGGKITPKVSDTAAPSGPKDQVKVSSLEAAKPGENSAPAARLQALEEDIVARDKALRDANARLAELEKSIQELQKLVELKNSGMAQAQQAAQGGAAPGAPAPAASPQAGVAAPAPAPAPASAPPAASAPAEAPAPKAKPVPPPGPVEEPGFLASLFADPLTLVGGGGILALLLAYVGFKMRSRREESQPVASQLATEFPESTSSVFGAKGGQSVDTGNSSLMQTDFSQSGLAAIDAEEGVDPVAEADVYMAYGRDAQAEEILIDALKVDPSRGAVYVKLLEIYAQRKSLKQFESLATDFYSLTGGKGTDWEKAAAIGRKLDANNPLYGAPTDDLASAMEDSAPVQARSSLDRPQSQNLAAAASAAWAAAVAPNESAAPADQVDMDATVFPPPKAQDAQADVQSLDFSLDLGEVDLSEQPQAASPIGAVDDTAGLDFDLDVGPDTIPALDILSGNAAQAAMAATALGDEDFGSDARDIPAVEEAVFKLPEDAAAENRPIDLAATVLASPGMAPADSQEVDLEKTSISLEDDIPAVEEVDFKLGGDAAAGNVPIDLAATVLASAGVASTDSQEMDLEQTDFDLEHTSFDLERTSFSPDGQHFDYETDTQPQRTRPVIDLSGIDLNLPGTIEETSLEPLDTPAPDAAADSSEEAETKLELARAYEEMGDRDGAKELLEEVIKEGSNAQKNAARGLLARLA